MSDGRRPIPPVARGLLAEIPEEFVDDGCSTAPDALFGFRLGWACRIHDWMYCTRAWPAGTMDQHHRKHADDLLGEMIRQALPWRWRFVGWIYRAAVRRHGGHAAFDSCGGEAGERCRHNLPRPGWMEV